MSTSVKISQLVETPVIGPNDSVPIARGNLETFRTPARQFVSEGLNVGQGPGRLFALKSTVTPTTLQFRTLSAVGENLAIATVGNTVVFEMSGQTPYKMTFFGEGNRTVWPLAPFNSVNAANYRVDIDGVLQEPFTDYSLSANNIIFTEAPYLSGKVVIVSSNVVRLNEAIVAPGSVTVDLFSPSFYNNEAKYLVLPTVSAVSALDTNAPEGSVSYTSNNGLLYYKNFNGWLPVGGKLGSVTRPAPNAQAIIDAGDSLGDGAYWIESLTGPVLTYCDMTNGGYMLAAVLENSTSTLWSYNGSLWTVVSPYQENETAVYKTETSALNSVNRLFYEYTLTTGIRCCLGNKNNALFYNFDTGSARSLFLSPVNTRPTSFLRSAWLNWFQTGTGIDPNTVPGSPSQGFQQNCNTEGFNTNIPFVNGLRFGINFNEQNDCASCDSMIGFGSNTNSIQAGGYSFTGAGATLHRGTGYIFIK